MHATDRRRPLAPFEIIGGTVDLVINDRRVVILGGARMSDDGRGMRPLQTVILQMQCLQRGRYHRQRIERAVEIADVTGEEFSALHRSAGFRLRFEHHHVPAGVGQHRSGDQPLWPAPITTASALCVAHFGSSRRSASAANRARRWAFTIPGIGRGQCQSTRHPIERPGVRHFGHLDATARPTIPGRSLVRAPPKGRPLARK